MSQDTEVDMKEVELNELEPEKQPMNASPPAGSLGSLGEKNGVVKVKVPEEEDEGEVGPGAKFTGLSKEELLQVAGTPAWVRTRWALLILFWLGWLGMLAGAIVIIVRAPRCKDLPAQEWWDKGGFYRIQSLKDFQDSDSDSIGDLAGVKQRIDYLGSLKVKGLVIGPLHVNAEDSLAGTNLTVIDSRFGTEIQFRELIQAAKKKSLKIVLDLTPNYRGQDKWFDPRILSSSDFQAQMKDAMAHWLKFGVFGIQVSGVESFTDSTLLSDWKNVTSQYSGDDDARVLIAATSEITPQRIFSLLNMTEGADLLTSQYLLGLDVDSSERKSGDEIARMIKNYISAAGNRSLSWSVGGPQVGHMASLVGERLLRLYHVLLFTLPGTPFVDYGDEIGLEDLPKLPGQPASFNMTRMQWNNQHNFGFSESGQNADSASNVTVQSQDGDKTSVLALFRALSDLRGKERSLLHGEFVSLGSDQPDVCAYLRRWDQNERFLVLLNFGDTESAVSLTPPKAADLLTEAAVVLSTDPQRGEGQLSLRQLKLGASEGLLLRFPYVA